MLSFIRKHSGSVFVKVFLCLIAFTFLFFFGMSDVIRKCTGKDYVIKVGDFKIGPNLLKYEYLKRCERFRNLGISDENTMLGIVINQIIDEQLIDQISKNSGISVSEKLIKNYMRSVPEFMDTKTGQFNKAAVRNFMASMHMPEKTFIDFIRRNIEQTVLLAPISCVSTMPAMSYYVAGNLEKRTIKYAFIPEDIFSSNENFIDKDLKCFFNDNKDKFMEPETRDFSVLIIDESNVEQTIKVSEEDIKQEYNESGETENFNIVHDKLKNTLQSRKLKAELKKLKMSIEDDFVAGIPVSDMVKQYNLRTVQFKNVTRNQTFNSSMDLPFINEAMSEVFQLKACREGSFVEGLDKNNKKVHWIVKVDVIKPTHVSDYDKVKDKIILEYKKSKINEKMLGLAQSFVDKINDGNVIDSVIGNFKMSVITNLSREEKLNSEKVQNEMLSQEIINQIFDLPNLKAGYAKIKNGCIVFQIISINDDKDIKKEDINKYGKQLIQEMSSDLYQQFKVYFGKQLEIKFNKDMLKNYDNIPDIEF